MSESLFKTTVVNTEGVDGIAYVDRKDGLRVVTSSPLNDLPGTNPEELFGLALTTCLNATIQSLLKARGKENQSKVTSDIHLKREKNGIGYFFEVNVFAAIEGLSVEDAQTVVESAEKRCPVAKLTQGATTLTIHTVAYE
jgi:organic hydroperoxide reductase OsmC/OhrA